MTGHLPVKLPDQVKDLKDFKPLLLERKTHKLQLFLNFVLG